MSDEVSGTTRTVFVVADPVFQVRTPQAQNALWAARGADLITVPARVAADDLERFLDGMRANGSVAGAVVSVPHKQAAAPLCDELGPGATLVGAVNTIRRSDDGRLIGETFDGAGFVAGLRAQGVDPRGRRVRLLGAGGAAASIAFALAEAGIASLEIVNRSADRAADLAARLGATGFAAATVATGGGSAEADVIVNGTSLGMRPDDDPRFAFDGVVAGGTAADVIVSNELTPFLRQASDAGLTTHGGRHMLDGQMPLIADYLMG